MAENQTIEAPDFDKIKKESGSATRDAIQLLWFVANNEAAERRRGVRAAQEESLRKVKSIAPTTQQDNFDTEGSPLVEFTSTVAFNLTGLRNGQSGMLRVLYNRGSATVTVKYNSGSSDASNRFDMQGAADVSLTTGKSVVFRYFGGVWRQMVLA